ARIIVREMDLLGAEADCVKETARAWLDHQRRPAFGELPLAVQRRCLQLQLFNLGLPTDFGLIEMLRVIGGRPIPVSGECVVLRDARGLLSCKTAVPTRFASDCRLLDLKPGTGRAGFAHLTVRWRIAKQTSPRLPRRLAGCEWFDADKIGPRIVLRHWCRGDRFQPIGMEKGVKLQDLFTNAKISREQRHRLVVAETVAGQLFWVEGLRISERFKLDKDTVRRLKWQWQGGKEPPVAAGG
ncbi:MAG TPA: tRNA lysidine(34) synthetase TilS, partial [Verrucomicrobiae bacterium]